MDYMPFVKLLSEASVSRQVATHGTVPGLSNRPDEYLMFECSALKQAFRTAEEFPGDEPHVWAVMAEVFTAMNAVLRAVGAHELKLIDYGMFLEFLDVGSETFDA
ncbi:MULTISPECIES: hypothetical protein [Rhizobium]|uniref:hypothetical protein n=1 Tax=Rhizobium TaxID=379 RepID=UPI001C90CD9E|nr:MULTISPECIES: hypothetical protein [Rhizobium]MBY3173106.1 hypothetical protein [Rhizobium leguminosarum]MBY3366520.1 hypothetical protein [Rhizobium laguerreae]